MNKLNAFKTYNSISTEKAHKQVIFLYINNVDCDKIVEITGYAKSTIRNYCNKYYDDYCESCKECFYIPNLVEGITCLCDELPKGQNQVYLVKFYGANGDFLFSKIGTTTRTVKQRVREEIRSYNKTFTVTGAIIEKIEDCEDTPPEGAESYLRASLIKKYPHTYLKNDRFMNLDIPAEDFIALLNDYFS